METLEKFVGVLHGARGNMEGHVTLTETEYGTQLDHMKSPAEYQVAGACLIKYCLIKYCMEDILWYTGAIYHYKRPILSYFDFR